MTPFLVWLVVATFADAVLLLLLYSYLWLRSPTKPKMRLREPADISAFRSLDYRGRELLLPGFHLLSVFPPTPTLYETEARDQILTFTEFTV